MAKATTNLSIIPAPEKMIRQSGNFILSNKTTIVADEKSYPIAKKFVGELSPATGFELAIGSSESTQSIVLKLSDKLEILGTEGYRLEISNKNIEIQAFAEAGLFYATRTLLQLLPIDIFRKAKVENSKWNIPCASIEDKPRFSWRGSMLDPARYYLPKEFVLKYIDLLALHKMNTLHFHLTEDQGWRMEIKKYPKLTSIGAWRNETVTGHERNLPRRMNNTPHGGFYTQEDLREIVAYAKSRFITVIPEIEIPGHSTAALAAYPEFGNTDKPMEVSTGWGVHFNTYNVNEKTFKFLEDVLSEVLEVFPSEFIHIGGDEAPKDQWKESKSAQKRMKALKLKNEEGLQSYFIRRIEKFLNKKGRRLIGWDEIMEGGLAPNATVMSWRGEEGGIKAAKAGHDVVMAPTGWTYFDYYQGEPKTEPLAIGGFLPLEKVYSYNPIPKILNKKQAQHVLGTQGQLWGEYMPDAKQVEYMAFPRICALAEVAWSQQKLKNYPDFLKRLKPHLMRMDRIDVKYFDPFQA